MSTDNSNKALQVEAEEALKALDETLGGILLKERKACKYAAYFPENTEELKKSIAAIQAFVKQHEGARATYVQHLKSLECE